MYTDWGWKCLMYGERANFYLKDAMQLGVEVMLCEKQQGSNKKKINF